MFFKFRQPVTNKRFNPSKYKTRNKRGLEIPEIYVEYKEERFQYTGIKNWYGIAKWDQRAVIASRLQENAKKTVFEQW